jgi:hypothetical protein
VLFSGYATNAADSRVADHRANRQSRLWTSVVLAMDGKREITEHRAVLGITISEAFAFIYLLIRYRVRIADFQIHIASDRHDYLTQKQWTQAHHSGDADCRWCLRYAACPTCGYGDYHHYAQQHEQHLALGQEVILNSKIVDSLFSL